jgi:hypothetical protein
MPAAKPHTLLPAPSSPQQTQATPELPELLDMLLEASHQAAAWEEHKKSLLGTLTVLHELGKIDDKLSHQGYNITYSPGRRSYDYPADVVELEAHLQEAKEAAVAAKLAVLKPSTPFWSVRKPKPAKASQEAA